MSTATSEVAGKYLTFRLAAEEYGLQILKVQEILGLMSVTRVPRTPPFIRGVVNLRGKVIPVVDLRRKFRLPVVADTKRTCIIIAQIDRADGALTLGAVVDQVSEVQNIPPEAIEPPPAIGQAIDTAFITGLGKAGRKVVVMLDIDRVLSDSETRAVAGSQDQTNNSRSIP